VNFGKIDTAKVGLAEVKVLRIKTYYGRSCCWF